MATDLDEQVSDFILRVTDAMGLTLASSIDEFPDHVRVNLSGDDADVLVRRKGEALDALQVIVNTAFGREARIPDLPVRHEWHGLGEQRRLVPQDRGDFEKTRLATPCSFPTTRSLRLRRRRGEAESASCACRDRMRSGSRRVCSGLRPRPRVTPRLRA